MGWPKGVRRQGPGGKKATPGDPPPNPPKRERKTKSSQTRDVVVPIQLHVKVDGSCGLSSEAITGAIRDLNQVVDRMVKVLIQYDHHNKEGVILQGQEIDTLITEIRGLRDDLLKKALMTPEMKPPEARVDLGPVLEELRGIKELLEKNSSGKKYSKTPSVIPEKFDARGKRVVPPGFTET
jgi:hypothetical protein